MEFWALEVKSGEALRVEPGEGMVLHLSQACVGEVKKEKGNESVCLFVNVDEKKLVLGTLFSEKLPQQQYDLVFDRDFVLSHNWKSGSVFFYGYKATNPFDDEDDEEDSDSESEEDIPITFENNGKHATKVKEDKTADAKKANAEKNSASGKPKVKIVEPNEDKDEESSDGDVSMSEDEDDEDEDGDGSTSEDEEDDSKEETPQKVATSKKRTTDSAVKTPRPDKKAKVSPQKTDGKKGGGHVATPHPSAGKTPANKSQQSPKSAGASHTCKSCSKTFGSQTALESHSKAKHSAGK